MITHLFPLGAKVRVRCGVSDPEFPYIALDGWTGIIEDMEQVGEQISYLIEWDQRTFASMPPLYLERCNRLDFEPESVWLGEEDIEADEGDGSDPPP